MAYTQIKLVDFKPVHHNSDLDNALARKAHYDSELSRIKAAALIQKAKDNGFPIKVQGAQDE